MELLIILSVCLFTLTNIAAVEAGETATALEEFMKNNVNQSTDFFFNLRSGSMLFSTLSPSAFQNLLSTTSLSNSPAPKELISLSSEISKLQTISVSSVSQISLSISLGDFTNLASDTISVSSSTTVDLVYIFQGSSIHPTPTGIPLLTTDLTGLDGNNLVTTEMPMHFVTNRKATPNLPFTPVIQSKDIGLHLQTRSLNLRTSSGTTLSLVNSVRNSNTLSEMSPIGSSVFYLSPSSSLIDGDPYSTSSSSNQKQTLSIDSLTNSSLINLRPTSADTVTSTEPTATNTSLNSAKDPTNGVDSNTKDSIYPFTYTFTSNSTSSLIFVMPVIVCVVLASMLFTVLKRWHFYCKLKKYRLRSSTTAESALSSTVTPSQRPSTSNADITNIGQNQAMTSPAGATAPHKRAANAPSHRTFDKTDKRYKPGLEYINRGFKYSPNCPVHGRRLSRKQSTQAVIEV